MNIKEGKGMKMVLFKRIFTIAILTMVVGLTPHSDAQTWKKITPDSGSGGSGTGGTTNVNNAITAPSCYYTDAACGTGFSAMPGNYGSHGICCSSASSGSSTPSFADTNPIPFDIPNDSAYPNSMVLAPIVQISGISEADLSITSNGTAAYRLCADASCTDVTNNWGTSTVTVTDGQYFQVRAQAPSASGQITLSSLTIGEFTDEWSILVTGDTTPNAFDIVSATVVPTNVYTSIIQQVTGMDEAVIDVSGETVEYRTCSDASCSSVIQDWTASQSVINNNDYYQIRQTGGSDEEIRPGTLEIGTVTDNWNTYSTNGFIVFATEAVYDGNLGGVAGADAKCAAAATQYNNLPTGATYRAWLSTSASTPLTRFENAGTSEIIRRIDLTKIADNWADLISGTIDDDINKDNSHNDPSQTYVWTGTNTNGAYYPGSYTACEGWTDNSYVDSSDRAYIGRKDYNNSPWTRNGLQPCHNSNHLYCFMTVK